MFDWFTKKNNRLFYFSVVYVPIIAWLLFSFYAPRHPLVDVLAEYSFILLPVSSLLGIIMLIEAGSRSIKKKPSYYLSWTGFITLFLNLSIVVGTSMLNQ